MAEDGEILGWLGDSRDLKEFVKIEGGEYDLSGLGKVNITPFEICKYPVTNQWYKEFMDSRGYENTEYWSTHGQEWQAAAAGKNGREYAWGEGFNKNKCNSFESRIGRTSAVGIFVEGNTPEGIADLSGNVWEWTKTQYNTKNSANDFKIDKNSNR